MLNVFAGVAAFGFLAAYLVPTASAMAEGTPGSRFDTVQENAQVYVAAANLTPAGSLVYGAGYGVKLEPQSDGSPHPKASAEEWAAYAATKDVEVPAGATREEIQAAIDEAAKKAEEEAKKAEEAQAAKAQPAASSGAIALGSPLYTGGGAPSDWMAAAGIAQSDWGYVDYIVSRESGWNPNATNASSGACGLVQALPCSKVPGGGYNPVANLQWATGYATGRYGSWAGAYAFWTANHWW